MMDQIAFVTLRNSGGHVNKKSKSRRTHIRLCAVIELYCAAPEQRWRMGSGNLLERLIKSRCRDLAIVRLDYPGGSVEHFTDSVARGSGDKRNRNKIEKRKPVIDFV